jgi:hypothetical protein
MFEPSGMRDIASTPHAIPTSMPSAAMIPAIMWLACCEEPHCVSTVVAAASYGSPASSQAWRATLPACSPACVTQPPTICSTSDGSIPARFTTSICDAASSSVACNPESHPLRRPIGVRTASMITGFPIAISFRWARTGVHRPSS